ncbi:hypothetical protein EST38_g5826 [Candolleomyces aberdarensis]|uniref:Uncharacterized protein n=1 Tax=Candolleomyces aberdarensis TaxID=2316362 RepID=A0A4Q2DJE6_9AGAR|nr:hypothetical protein EST38_g5826 [Candolleomyces aberdarensis]
MLNKLTSVAFAAFALILTLQATTVSGSPMAVSELEQRGKLGFDMDAAPPDSASGHGSAY